MLSLPSSTDGSNLRGYTGNCVCIDEAAYVSHLDNIMNAINPTLSRDDNAELILTTTPAGKNGDFYELYSDALSVNDHSLKLRSAKSSSFAFNSDQHISSLGY